MKRCDLLLFSDYLKKLPSAIVFKHIIKDDTSRKIVSSTRLDSIAEDFLSHESLLARFQSLGSDAQKLCSFIYLFGANGIKINEKMPEHEELLLSFLVYSAKDSNNCSYFFGFIDTEKQLRIILASYIIPVTLSDIETTILPPPFLKMRCLSDFTVLITLAFKEILKKKRNTTLVQTAVDALGKQLHTRSENCLFHNIKTDKTVIIDFLFKYGIERRYLSDDKDAYSTTIAQINQWFSYTNAELYENLVNYAIEYSGAWNKEVFKNISDTSQSKWFSTAQFPEFCQDDLKTVIQLLNYVGIIEVIKIENDILWRNLTETIEFNQKESNLQVMILPDFSAIIPQEVMPEVLYEFAVLGNFTNLDRVYKGIISKGIINESLSIGVDGDLIITHLLKWQAPSNVLETVKEWIREYSRLSILNTSTIISCDENTSKQISAYLPLSESIEEVKADKVFKIKKGREQEVKGMLSSMGFDSRVPELKIAKPVPADCFWTHKSENEFIVVFDFEKIIHHPDKKIKSGKYSEDLKELEMSDIVHVIDYAILMNNKLIIEYGGCEKIEKGMYTFIPRKISSDTDQVIEGVEIETFELRRYTIKKIIRIGVKTT